MTLPSKNHTLLVSRGDMSIEILFGRWALYGNPLKTIFWDPSTASTHQKVSVLNLLAHFWTSFEFQGSRKDVQKWQEIIFRGPGASRGRLPLDGWFRNAFEPHFGRHFALFWPPLWMIALGVVCMVSFVSVTRYLPKMLQFWDLDTWDQVHFRNVVQNEISSPPHFLKNVPASVVHFSGI
jgi:hypothetical protein